MMTIKDACSTPANFMYLWASEKDFLRYIPKKYADIIRVKKANQLKIVNIIADYKEDVVKNYKEQIKQAFVDAYDMRPEEALVILAQGGTVAGKNWSEGVYGVGVLYPTTFAGTDISVRPNDGYFERNGKILPGNEDKNVYATINKKTVVYQRFYEDDTNGVTYMSQYNKTTKKYYAKSYSNANGTFSARNGAEIKASDGADLWGTILGYLDKFLNWLITLFGGTDRQLLSAENTIPSQTQDGFVQEAGMGEAGMILVALAAGNEEKQKSINSNK